MFGWKEQALRGLSSSYPFLSCLSLSLPALLALCVCGGGGKGGNLMYDGNTCYHGDYGAV